MVYRLADNRTYVHTNWGRGFKLPSLYALGNPIIGNQELRVERSEALNLTIERHFLYDQTGLSLGLFYNRFMDQMDMQTSFRAGQGLMLTGHIDYLETNIRGTTEELRNRPA